jgi:uncharacterized membrane protein
MCRRKKVRWSMLLSHHPPSQYSRTYCFFGIRICARCSGIVLGMLLSLLLSFSLSWYIIVILPLPTFVNFLLQELALIRSVNFLKTILTVPLGFYLFILAKNLINLDLFWVALMIIYLLFIEFILAYILIRNKRIEKLIEEYERGIYLE